MPSVKRCRRGWWFGLLVLAWGCEDDQCQAGERWCEENKVTFCAEQTDCTFLHCTGEKQIEVERDCGALGAHCTEFVEPGGETTALCSLTNHPCPLGLESLCVGSALGVCHPQSNYPEWVVDCSVAAPGGICEQQGAEAGCR